MIRKPFRNSFDKLQDIFVPNFWSETKMGRIQSMLCRLLDNFTLLSTNQIIVCQQEHLQSEL